MSYVRFQTGMRCRRTGRFLGIFHAAGRLQDEGCVEPWFESQLDDTLRWFNCHLPVPKKDTIPSRCLFWFDRANSAVIGNIWDLVLWLRQHDVFVTSQVESDPGLIVYSDEFQVGAIPSSRIIRVLNLKRN